MPPLVRSLPHVETLSLFRVEEGEEEKSARQALGLATEHDASLPTNSGMPDASTNGPMSAAATHNGDPFPEAAYSQNAQSTSDEAVSAALQPAQAAPSVRAGSPTVTESRPVRPPTPQTALADTEGTPHTGSIAILQGRATPSAMPSSSGTPAPSMRPPEAVVPDRAPMDQDDEDEPMPTIDVDSDSD